jgi:long-chain acyl-CoA synthetase
MDKLDIAERYTVGEADAAFDDIVTNAELYPEAIAELYPEAIAVSRQVEGGWSPVTCRALAAEVEALAGGLIASGIAAGDGVAVLSRTRYEWLRDDFAFLRVGAVTVPIYETSAPAQIEWIMSDSGAVAVFAEDEEHAARVHALQDRLPDLRTVWTFTADLPGLMEQGRKVGSDPVAARRSAVRARDIATIVYTSGTTGQPKGCVLTHANLVGTVRNIAEADGVHDLVFNDHQSTLLFLPLAHILARVIQNSALHARVRLGHLPDMKQVPEGLRSFRPTVVLSVPRVFEKIYNTAQRSASHGAKKHLFAAADRTAVAYSRALDTGGAGLRLRALHAVFDVLVYRKIRAAMGGQVRWAVSGGAPLGETLGHFFRGLGVTVLEGYGLTETTAGGTLNLPGAQRVGSVGRPDPGCSIRTEEDGEILLRGVYVFQGYWHNDEATRDVLDEEGWLRTGDIGRIDDDGFVRITDRKKDLIVTAAGKNVAPTLLEDRLRASWLISQAAVFGDKQPYISALLTLDTEAVAVWRDQQGRPADQPLDQLTEDPELLHELQQAVDATNALVSHAEAIKRWRVLATDFTEASGELTPTLKLRRNVVAERFAEDIALLYS